jgi:hypothetical protein
MPVQASDRLDASGLRSRIVAGAVLLAILLVGAEFSRLAHGLTLGLYRSQDRAIALLYLVGLLALAFVAPRSPRLKAPSLSLPFVFAAAAGLALLLWAGAYLVFGGYAFTRDEQMALFDAAIFGEFRTAAPVAAEWRSLAPAMAPLYLLPAQGNEAWTSAYLPGNAALHAAFAFIGDPRLLNPLMAGLGLVFLYLLVRRLFAEALSAQWAALLLYATSSQMAVAAMTPFAMTGHMTLNLLWLTLFLRGGKVGHAGAAATGFVATGFHQIIFHPLFVLPFVIWLWSKGERRAAVFYLFVYGIAAAFWMAYPGLSLAAAGAAGAGTGAGGLSTFMTERILPLIVNRDPATLPLMDFNLLRFITWQNMALIPLCLCAIPAVRKGEGIARPLFVGTLLTLAAMLLLLPYQSIGWGYRYLHGLLGSFALLGAYGWQHIADGEGRRRILLAGSAVSLCLALPHLSWQTRGLVEPSRAVDRMIESLDADFVIVDPPGLAMDQVRNDPFLRNRPLRFSSAHLGAADVDLLCGRGRVAFVDRQAMIAMGLGAMGEPDQRHFLQLRSRIAGEPCVSDPRLEKAAGRGR